ncbi:MAG: osmotically inducible protein OsmC [Planctomycetes bacterium RBG_16_59_8]|nr:MAG: osmotically inducible protein OsmC [Planctomycetes bacterium RBG_16_59_8]
MVKIDIDYLGNLHCRLRHGPSGAEIATDAPKDNQGKGEAFSPTDLVAAALGSCMATVMGIVAQRHKIDLAGMKIEVVKEMAQAPARRIGRLTVTIAMPGDLPPDRRDMLKRAEESCPVYKSLAPETLVETSFHWPEGERVTGT